MNSISKRTTVVGSMCSVMLGACLAMLGTLPMAAQDAGTPQQADSGQPGGRPNMDQMLDHQLEHLTKAVSLTPDQVAQVRPILKTQMSQMMALRQDTQTAPQDKHAQMMKIHTDAQTQIRGLLTSDQQTKYDAMLAQEQQHRGRRNGGMGGMNGGDGSTPPQP
jgi:protein CpxP